MKSKYDTFMDKYQPKSLSDIIGNKTQILQIKEWLNKYNENKEKTLKDPKKRKKKSIIIPENICDEIDEITTDDIPIDDTNDKDDITYSQKYNNTGPRSCMIIIGDHGVGKTCTVNATLNNLGYTVQTINLTKIGSNKNILENVEKIMKHDNILDHLNNNVSSKIVIIVDEIESASSPVEKNFILTLLKKNEEKWYYPIIFISNGAHSKLTTLLKKTSNVIYFGKPSDENLMLYFLNICKNENMHFEKQENAIKLIEHSQRDYRRLLLILQDLKSTHGTKLINDVNIEEYCNISKSKDIDIDIYKATSNMILKYENIDECLRLYEGEKVIIPLVMHQNYIKCITNYHPKINIINKTNNIFLLANTIAMSMAQGDLIENYIYSDQNWDMQEVHGFLTCVNPSFKLSNRKLKISENYLSIALNFPIDLNRTSIKRINKRNVINSNMCLKNAEIKDFIYANRLIRKLLDNNKLDACANLFKGYNAKVENIESILKIDKINESKTIIPTIIKKRLAILLEK